MYVRIISAKSYGHLIPVVVLLPVKELEQEIKEIPIEGKEPVIVEQHLRFHLFIQMELNKMKEVFIAKNGRPYVKDENGKVRFISSTEWKEYQSNTNASNRGKYLMVVIFIALVTVYAANNIGVLL
tara:strand:- start:144 stop:521 length:378 start_codon:yes stop_codon:yes gene_type:complete